jgi:hypothetical protein
MLKKKGPVPCHPPGTCTATAAGGRVPGGRCTCRTWSTPHPCLLWRCRCRAARQVPCQCRSWGCRCTCRENIQKVSTCHGIRTAADRMPKSCPKCSYHCQKFQVVLYWLQQLKVDCCCVPGTLPPLCQSPVSASSPAANAHQKSIACSFQEWAAHSIQDQHGGQHRMRCSSAIFAPSPGTQDCAEGLAGLRVYYVTRNGGHTAPAMHEQCQNP